MRKGRKMWSLLTKLPLIKKFNPEYICTDMSTQRHLTFWECTSSQYSKWGKEGKNVIVMNQTITHHTNSILNVHKHVYSKATYRFWVVLFTVQQVGKGRKIWSLATKIVTYPTDSVLSMHKYVNLKATYPLRVHRFTT